MTTERGDFRERDLGGIIDELFKVYRKNFWSFIGIVAAAEIPLLLMGALLSWYASTSPLEGTGERTLVSLLTVVLVIASILAGLLMTVAVVYAVAGHYLGKRIEIGQAYQFTLGRLGSLVGAAFLSGLAVVAMAITLIGIPAAIYFGITWAFIVPAVVLERCGATKALSRSSFWVKGSWWRVLGILIVLWLMGAILGGLASGIVSWIVGSIVEGAGASQDLIDRVSNFAAGLVGIIFTPMVLIGTTLLYFDLRIRKEGYSLQGMAQELERRRGVL